MDKKWDALSYLVIGFLFLLLAGRWPLLPNFIDIYHHIVTAQGFLKAGGFVAHDFWSFAPEGRPNLYPPLFHLILLVFLKAGVPALAVARGADIVIFPLLLLALFVFVRGSLNSRVAFFSVLIAASLYSLYLASSNFIPASLACILGLFSLWAQEKNKTIAASIFLGLCFYAHAQVPWFFVVAYFLYGIARPDRFRRCAGILVSALVLSLPILIYLFRMRAFYAPQARYENFALEFNLYVLLAAFGVRQVIRNKNSSLLPVCLALAVIPFIASYPYRYISGQGLVGFVVLSAVGLARLYDVATGIAGARARAQGLVLLVFVLVFTFLSPAIIVQRGRAATFSLLNSTYVNLIDFHRAARPNDFSISNSRYMRSLIDIIRSNSAQDDIICANLPFAGTVLSALAGRADARGMLAEVRTSASRDPYSQARLVIWFKEEPPPAAYGLQEIAQTDIAVVLRNTATPARQQVRKADISYGWLAGILACVALFLVRDLA